MDHASGRLSVWGGGMKANAEFKFKGQGMGGCGGQGGTRAWARALSPPSAIPAVALAPCRLLALTSVSPREPNTLTERRWPHPFQAISQCEELGGGPAVSASSVQGPLLTVFAVFLSVQMEQRQRWVQPVCTLLRFDKLRHTAHTPSPPVPYALSGPCCPYL